jgi:hypothetical protein
MKITNKFNLPEPIVNAIKRPTYSKGGANLSVTEMIGSPRISQLRRLNYEHLTMDASEGVFPLFGTAVHNVLEKGIADNHVKEERIHTELDGWTISGAIDLQITHPDGIVIQDYKTVGAWAVMNEKIEWEQQLNIYAWLVSRVKGQHVKAIEIVAIVRDWSWREAEYKEGYPASAIVTLPIKLWTYEEQEQYVRERVHFHAEAYFAAESNSELPLCSKEEMWEKPTTWAVIKVGAARAKKVCYSKVDADLHLAESGKGYEIQHRPGERVRCGQYCQVKDFCSQWQEYNGGKNDGQD